MDIILITPPDYRKNETEILEAAFQSGVHIHIRKKKADTTLLDYLDRISMHIIQNSTLHYHWDIFKEYDFKGFHISQKKTTDSLVVLKKQLPPDSTLSTSLHSYQELEHKAHEYDYVFCSPVFKSISKKNHLPKFEWDVNPFKNGKTVLYALGGIHSENIETCFIKGFDGVGILGTIWNQKTTIDSITELKKIKATCDQLSLA